ncbi:hypothetical protein KKE06_03735 [Candidatus Micrarchaeota archaeon]|nr:hypothetical protein [Candidatus Micrarchaeota archaeon]MBU1930359.1 hypothetical protein [Candidatus Micrarchaeota archaeon]
MKPKGQLLSLDFLFAIGLIFLAMGITLKFGEMFAFEWQSHQQQIELEHYGQTAGFLLMASPSLICQMENSTGAPIVGLFVNNCIDTTKIVSKSALGLPSDYEYSVFNDSDQGLLAGSSTPSFDTKNIFATKLKAIVWSGDIPKAKVHKCLQERFPTAPDPEDEQIHCTLEKKDIILTVWK